jgi:hypothetical protein
MRNSQVEPGIRSGTYIGPYTDSVIVKRMKWPIHSRLLPFDFPALISGRLFDKRTERLVRASQSQMSFAGTAPSPPHVDEEPQMTASPSHMSMRSYACSLSGLLPKSMILECADVVCCAFWTRDSVIVVSNLR